MTVDAWWQQFWVQALGGAAGALIVTALLSALSEKVRDKLWKPVGRGLLRLPTVRLTTTGRVDAARIAAGAALEAQRGQYEKLLRDANRSLETTQVRLAAATDQVEAARAAGFEAGRAVAADDLRAAEVRADAEKAEAARARGEAAEAINQKQSEVNEARELARKAGLEQVENHGRLMEYARAQGAAEGRAEAEAEVAAQRAALTMRPVWRVISPDDDPWNPDTFELRNVQPGVGELSDVRLEQRMNSFLFNGPSQWPGRWDGPTRFRGERAGTGRSFDVEFDVHYRDANGDWRRGVATLARPVATPPPGGSVAARRSDDPLGPLPKQF